MYVIKQARIKLPIFYDCFKVTLSLITNDLIFYVQQIVLEKWENVIKKCSNSA
jgi:hypothetical protein